LINPLGIVDDDHEVRRCTHRPDSIGNREEKSRSKAVSAVGNATTGNVASQQLKTEPCRLTNLITETVESLDLAQQSYERQKGRRIVLLASAPHDHMTGDTISVGVKSGPSADIGKCVVDKAGLADTSCTFDDRNVNVARRRSLDDRLEVP